MGVCHIYVQSERNGYIIGKSCIDLVKNAMSEMHILTGIARLVHAFDLNLTTQILIFPC